MLTLSEVLVLDLEIDVRQLVLGDVPAHLDAHTLNAAVLLIELRELTHAAHHAFLLLVVLLPTGHAVGT